MKPWRWITKRISISEYDVKNDMLAKSSSWRKALRDALPDGYVTISKQVPIGEDWNDDMATGR